MQINFGTKIHYENKLNPLKSTQTTKKKWTYYKIYDKNDKYVGKFALEDSGRFYWENLNKHLGYITGLEIPEDIRGKKEAINILMNIKRLAYNEAMKRNMDVVHFSAGNNNPHHVAKLYKKIFPEAVHKFSDGYTRFAVPLRDTTQEEAKEVLDSFELIYRNLILNNETETSPLVGNELGMF